MSEVQSGWLAGLMALGFLGTIASGIRAKEDEAEAIQKLKDRGGRVVSVDEKAKERPVVAIDLSRATLTEAGFKELAAFTSLRSINLFPIQVTDGVLRGLREAGVLHALDWAFTRDGQRPRSPADVGYFIVRSQQVTAAGMKELAGFTSLQRLDLSQSALNDSAMKEAALFGSLRTLHLNKQITDAGLKELSALPSLKELTLALESPVTDEGLKHLAHIKSLQVLSLRGTKVTPAGLKGLAGLKLHTLFLGESQVTDTTLRVLREINLLHALSQASGKGQRATSLNTVVYLYLHGTQVSDAGLRELTGMTSLTGISLNRRVTDEGVAALQKALPGLKKIIR